jgi:hypothetical protein
MPYIFLEVILGDEVVIAKLYIHPAGVFAVFVAMLIGEVFKRLPCLLGIDHI